MVPFCLIYVTAKDKAEAERIGEALVAKRLAAGVNVIDGIASIYYWRGKIEKTTEALLLVKTRSTLEPKVCKLIKQMHSYACPCIVAVPIQKGDPPFLAWIRKETKQGKTS